MLNSGPGYIWAHWLQEKLKSKNADKWTNSLQASDSDIFDVAGCLSLKIADLRLWVTIDLYEHINFELGNWIFSSWWSIVCQYLKIKDCGISMALFVFDTLLRFQIISRFFQNTFISKKVMNWQVSICLTKYRKKSYFRSKFLIEKLFLTIYSTFVEKQ